MKETKFLNLPKGVVAGRTTKKEEKYTSLIISLNRELKAEITDWGSNLMDYSFLIKFYLICLFTRNLGDLSAPEAFQQF